MSALSNNLVGEAGDDVDVALDASSGGVLLCQEGGVHVLHPLWIRERLNGPETVDAVNGQRLFEPLDGQAKTSITWCTLDQHVLNVEFSDGLCGSVTRRLLDRALHIGERSEDPPTPMPWTATDLSLTAIDWNELDGGSTARIEAELAVLAAFFQRGAFVLRGTPTTPGSLREIAGRFGRISATNFGELFDVRTEPVPVDLAYTPVALSAHTDQPYRHPTPGLQFLHALVNDAPGGDSTIVDGLAAVEALRVADPEAFDLLSRVPVEFRYDTGNDVKVARAPLIDLASDGSLRQIRFSPRLDFAPLLEPATLDIYYRGQRWFANALNDPDRQVTFRLHAGDVLVVDNHRVLHGRTAFDPTVGARHLQGCYIDHDGPVTMWTLAIRAQHSAAAVTRPMQTAEQGSS